MGRKPGSADIPPPQPPDLLDRAAFITTEELAGFLRIPLNTVENWASLGRGPRFRKVGIYRRYASADVRAWLDVKDGGAEPAA